MNLIFRLVRVLIAALRRAPLDLHFTRYDQRVYIDEYWIKNYQGLAEEMNADSTARTVLVYPPNYDFPMKQYVPFPVVALDEPWPLTPEEADHLIADLDLPEDEYVDLVLYDPFFGDPRRLVSRELQEIAFPIGAEEWHGMLYYQPYITGSDELEMQPMRGEFEGVIALEAGMVEPRVSPGGVVRMAFQWRSPVPIEDSFKVFTHIVDPDGHLVAQHDDVPGSVRHTTNRGYEAAQRRQELTVAQQRGESQGAQERRASQGAQERRASQGAQERRESQGAQERRASQGAQERQESQGAQARRESQGASERRTGRASER